VLEAIPTAVWFTYDRDLRKVIGNRRASDLLRLPRETDLGTMLEQSQGFQVMRDGKSVPPADRPLHRAARGEGIEDKLLDVIFARGEHKRLLVRAGPLHDDRGELRGAVCAAADVTERHRYEDHLRLLLNELNHRVKNTLATVQSIAALTLRGADQSTRND